MENQIISLKQFKELVNVLSLDEKFIVSYYNSKNEIKEILAYKKITSFYFNAFFFSERITNLTRVIPLRNIISFFREETNINYYIINIQGEF